MSKDNEKELILVLGGARSGKSSWALQYAESNNETLLFLATAEVIDKEMEERVRLHKEIRGPKWNLIEEPLELSNVLKDSSPNYDVILIDCITVWLGNVLYKLGRDKAEYYIEKFLESLKLRSCNVIAVANEVGTGVVPAHESGRVFRDLSGSLHQKISAMADKVVFTIAGIPMFLK